jgi:hypothetical protein
LAWRRVEPEVTDGKPTLSFIIEGFGFGAILAVDDSLLPADLQAFFYEMHRLTVCDWIASPAGGIDCHRY